MASGTPPTSTLVQDRSTCFQATAGVSSPKLAAVFLLDNCLQLLSPTFQGQPMIGHWPMWGTEMLPSCLDSGTLPSCPSARSPREICGGIAVRHLPSSTPCAILRTFPNKFPAHELKYIPKSASWETCPETVASDLVLENRL